MNTLINWHRAHHPLMEAQDVVKLVFQAQMGCGHLLGDEALVAKRIEAEEAALIPAIHEPLTEPLGANYVRLNLRRAMAEGIKPLWIARLMKQSALPTASRQDVYDTLAQLQLPDVTQVAQRLLNEPTWLPSHTQAYHAAYAPAYRVISCQCAKILPALMAIARLNSKDRLFICIDGPCGSGKSTAAALLQNVLDAALIPMDDFFLPHPRKTAQRLAQPGGNADWERVVEEIVIPWQQGKAFSYRPYDCHADCLGTPVEVPIKRVTLLEGSYSLVPAIRQHADVCLFMYIAPQEQHQRILERNGEKVLQMFVDRWIPLEQAYFAAYGLPDDQCTVLGHLHSTY